MSSALDYNHGAQSYSTPGKHKSRTPGATDRKRYAMP